MYASDQRPHDVPSEVSCDRASVGECTDILCFDTRASRAYNAVARRPMHVRRGEGVQKSYYMAQTAVCASTAEYTALRVHLTRHVLVCRGPRGGINSANFRFPMSCGCPLRQAGSDACCRRSRSRKRSMFSSPPDLRAHAPRGRGTSIVWTGPLVQHRRDARDRIVGDYLSLMVHEQSTEKVLN